MRYFNACACIAVLALLAVVPAWGQDFTYSNDFNSYANGAKPPGWVTQFFSPDIPYVNGRTMAPAVMTEDPSTWYVTPAGVVSDWWGSNVPWGGDTHQNYSADGWSGGHRFSVIHPGQWLAAYGNVGTAASAWYAGNGDANYPMNLQARGMRAEFDFMVRHGRMGPYSGDMALFAVQPVADATEAQLAAGNWDISPCWKTGGFAIEVDTYGHDGDPCPPIGDTSFNMGWNHIGLDVYSYSSGISLQTDIELLGGCGSPDPVPNPLPAMLVLGDYSVPLHFTVYYNRTISGTLNDGVTAYTDGGPGKVVVYLKIPASVAHPELWPNPWGASPSDTPEGRKIIDYDIGAWPAPGAIFGFTAGCGWADGVVAFDNINVTTGPAATGTAGPGPTVAALDPGPEVALPAPVAATNPGTPGWDVTTYLVGAPDMNTLKSNIAFNKANGWYVGHGTEPDIAFVDTGRNTHLGSARGLPGFLGHNMDRVGMLAKGWIVFPPGGDYPRHYSLGTASDDGFELTIGGTVVLSGSGEQAANLLVPAAGAYPIQLLWFEYGGGAAIEVYRRIIATDRATTYRFQSLGYTDHGIADQPRVYVTLGGAAAPDPTLAAAADFTATATLSAGERLAGSGSGSSGFRIKTIEGPRRYYNGDNVRDLYYSRDSSGEQWSTIPMRFLDFLGSYAYTSATINFRGTLPNGAGTCYDGMIAGQEFPGFPGAPGQFAFRADGFATFDNAGDYYLVMSGANQYYLRFGKQTVLCFYADGNNIPFRLHVDQAGTYPIRVECCMAAVGANIELAQLVPGQATPVLVNGPGSTIHVYQSASGTVPAFPFLPHGFAIPADRKVAEVGQGGTSGWNVTLAGGHSALVAAYSGYADTALHNNWWNMPMASSMGTDTPDFLDYTDPGPEIAGRFGGLLNWSRFPNAAASGNENFGVSALGYIEFPVAGDYGFNTTTRDGCTMWVAGQVIQSWPVYGNLPQDNDPTCVHIDAPGIYDIRVEYWNYLGASLLEMFQYLPDGTAALVNSSNATVHVYRTLTAGNPASIYHDPVVLPLSARAGALDMGRDPGVRAQVAAATVANAGYCDSFYSLEQATDLLNGVFKDDALAKLNHPGVLVTDQVIPAINVGDEAGIDFPGGGRDWLAIRFTGYIGLTQGGHTLACRSDDGMSMTIGGLNIGRMGGIHGCDWWLYYVYAPADGLYPIQLDYWDGWGGRSCRLLELISDWSAWLPVNTDPRVSTLYVNALPCGHPFADADHDDDVDQDDFGTFQSCFTGSISAASPTGLCRCFDREDGGVGNGVIDAADLTAFMDCWTGPAVLYSAALPPGCTP